jgi:uncharacterized protein DUF2809
MRPRPLTISIALLFATILSGLLIRFAPLGMPPLLVKYGGSALWAVSIYWLVSTLLPNMRVEGAAAITAAIATTVEFFKLYHSPPVDSFRLTLPGVLLLGRFFSLWDLLAYYVAICVAGSLDQSLRNSLPPTSHQG